MCGASFPSAVGSDLDVAAAATARQLCPNEQTLGPPADMSAMCPRPDPCTAADGIPKSITSSQTDARAVQRL